MKAHALFGFWVVGVVMAMVLQIVGYDIPEMQNFGVIFAIFYVFCLWMDARKGDF